MVSGYIYPTSRRVRVRVSYRCILASRCKRLALLNTVLLVQRWDSAYRVRRLPQLTVYTVALWYRGHDISTRPEICIRATSCHRETTRTIVPTEALCPEHDDWAARVPFLSRGISIHPPISLITSHATNLAHVVVSPPLPRQIVLRRPPFWAGLRLNPHLPPVVRSTPPARDHDWLGRPDDTGALLPGCC